MASGQIRMTPDTMRERAGEYRTEADNVQSVIDKMDRLLETLLTEWEGSASEAYANKFAELRPSFVKGKELIDDIAAALDKTAEARSIRSISMRSGVTATSARRRRRQFSQSLPACAFFSRTGICSA